MPANTAPIFSIAPDAQVGGSVLGPTAVTAQDGTGALALIFSADATNGGYVEVVQLKPIGSPVATVARIFFCTATGAYTPGTTNTAANTSLIEELTLPATTLSQVAAQSVYQIPIRRPLPLGTKLLISFGTSTGGAGTGYALTTFGGKY